MIRTTADMTLPNMMVPDGRMPGTTRWARPADWPEIIAPGPTEQRFVGLHAVFPNDENFVALSASGNYTVDWGDGLVQNFAAGAVAQRTFGFNGAGLSAVTSRGFRCTTIVVTPQAGQNLTALSLHHRHSRLGLQMYQSGFLDIALAGHLLATLRIATDDPATGNTVIRFDYLERVNVVRSIVSDWRNMFAGCTGLESVVALDTAAGTNFSSMFSSCTSLQTLPEINVAAGIDFSSMFFFCTRLQITPPLNAAAGTNFSSMFDTCASLRTVGAVNCASGTVFEFMFSKCSALQTIPLINTSAGITFDAMFMECSNLSVVPPLDTSAGLYFSRMFDGCSSLQTIPLLPTSRGTHFQRMFASCRNLRTVPLLDTSLGTDFSSMFHGCSSLRTVPLLNVSAGNRFSGMFSWCSSLQSIPALNMSLDTDGGFIFDNCNNLANIDATGFPQSFSVANCKLSGAALDKLYGNLAMVPGRTITVTGNYGVSADSTSIASARGWTVVGS